MQVLKRAALNPRKTSVFTQSGSDRMPDVIFGWFTRMWSIRTSINRSGKRSSSTWCERGRLGDSSWIGDKRVGNDQGELINGRSVGDSSSELNRWQVGRSGRLFVSIAASLSAALQLHADQRPVAATFRLRLHA
jgi:hypothetical protein